MRLVLLVALAVLGLSAPTNAAGAWTAIASPGANSTLNPVSEMTWDGTNLWIAANTELAGVMVRSWDGTAWTTYTQPQADTGLRNKMPAITWDGTSIWVAYNDDSDAVQVKRWNGSSWVAIASPAAANTGSIYTTPDLFVAGGVLHVAYQDSSRNIQVKSWNGSVWTAVGASPGGGGTMNTYPSLGWDGTRVWIAYNDGSNAAQVKYYNGASWIAHSSPTSGTGLNTVPSLLFVNGRMYANTEGASHVSLLKYWNGAAWVATPSPNPTTQTAFGYGNLVWDGTKLWASYTKDPEVITVVSESNVGPANPTGLGQFETGGAPSITSGAWTRSGNATNLVLTQSMSDPNGSESLTPWVEMQPQGTPFAETCGVDSGATTTFGAAVAAPTGGVGVTGTVNVTGLANATSYVWQACAVDQYGFPGGWIARGSIPDLRTDFSLPTAAQTTPLTAVTATQAPTLSATYTDPAPATTGRLDFEVCSASTCATASRTGSTAAGLPSPTTTGWTPAGLPPGIWYWRVRAVDVAGNVGNWTGTRSYTLVQRYQYLTGFESGVASNAGGDMFVFLNGTPTPDAVLKRNGTYSMRYAATGGSVDSAITVSGTAGVMRMALYVDALPSVTDNVFEYVTTGASEFGRIRLSPTGQLSVDQYGSGAPNAIVTGPTITAGQWYVLESRWNIGGATWVYDWRVDGVVQPQSSWARGSAGALVEGKWGLTGTATGTVHVDDVAYSQDLTEYPLGDGKVLGYMPSGVATHVGPGNFQSCSGAGCTLATVTAGDTTTAGFLDELPMSGVADYVQQSAASSTSYLEYAIADTTQSTAPDGVSILTSIRASNTFLNEICARATDNGVATSDVYPGCSVAPPAVGSTTTLYKGSVLAVAPSGGAWTAASFNALRLRWGYSSNVGGIPILDGAIVEANFRTAAPSSTAVPTVSGFAVVGQVLTTTTGTWTGSPSYTYQWSACDSAGANCVPVAGATASTFTLTASQVGMTMRATVTATNASGTGAATSLPTAVVTSSFSLTVSVDVATTSMSPAVLVPGGDATASTIVTINTPNPSGYTLTATDENDTWGADATTGGGTIPDWIGTDTTPLAWAAGTSGYWGVTVRAATGGATARLAKWGTGTNTAASDYVNNLYAGLDLSTSVLLHQRTTSFAGDDTVTVTHRVNAGAAQAAGAYGATVIFTATGLP